MYIYITLTCSIFMDMLLFLECFPLLKLVHLAVHLLVVTDDNKNFVFSDISVR